MPGEAIVTIRDRQWVCSLSSTPAELAAGLSGVPSLPPGTGMLFDLPREQIVTVTAEDMLFPLDVIFVGDNLLVTEVAFNLIPGDWETTGLPCRYFIEVNTGEANDINPGTPVSIELSGVPTSDGIEPVVALAGVVMVGALMVNMGKTMMGAVSRKPRERPVLYGPGGKRLLPRTRGAGELEFLPDSPEFLAYTIEDIGYRDKIDRAFQKAIARAQGG